MPSTNPYPFPDTLKQGVVGITHEMDPKNPFDVTGEWGRRWLCPQVDRTRQARKRAGVREGGFKRKQTTHKKIRVVVAGVHPAKR